MKSIFAGTVLLAAIALVPAGAEAGRLMLAPKP
jgi:hypothetical protein